MECDLFSSLEKYGNLKPIIDDNQLNLIVMNLADAIQTHYEENSCQDVLVVCVLKGASVFFADLIKQMDFPFKIDFITASSYGDSTKTSKNVKILKDIDSDISGRHVLIVEDIIDSGHTLVAIDKLLRFRNPASLKYCVLLDKKEARQVNFNPDWVGKEIPNVWVVGYGFENEGYGRNIPFICQKMS